MILKVESRELIQSAPPIDYAGRQQGETRKSDTLPSKGAYERRVPWPHRLLELSKKRGFEAKGKCPFHVSYFPFKKFRYPVMNTLIVIHD